MISFVSKETHSSSSSQKTDCFETFQGDLVRNDNVSSLSFYVNAFVTTNKAGGTYVE
mgnify:CR=1 FL=1